MSVVGGRLSPIFVQCRLAVGAPPPFLPAGVTGGVGSPVGEVYGSSTARLAGRSRAAVAPWMAYLFFDGWHLHHTGDWAHTRPPRKRPAQVAGVRWATPLSLRGKLVTQARLRVPHRRIGEARRPGPAGPDQVQVLIANATSLEANWSTIRSESWSCLMVQESRVHPASWLRTEVRRCGWKYISGEICSDGRDLVAIILKHGGVTEITGFRSERTCTAVWFPGGSVCIRLYCVYGEIGRASCRERV